MEKDTKCASRQTRGVNFVNELGAGRTWHQTSLELFPTGLEHAADVPRSGRRRRRSLALATIVAQAPLPPLGNTGVETAGGDA